MNVSATPLISVLAKINLVKIFVPITKEAMARLRDIARKERRRPQDQAAVLIEESLAAKAGEEPRTTEVESEKPAR